MTTQEPSSSSARRRQEQSVVKQRGIMHSYIEFAHVTGCVWWPCQNITAFSESRVIYFSLSSGVMSKYSINTMSVGRRQINTCKILWSWSLLYLSRLSRCTSICCDTSGAGVVVLVPGRMSSSIMSPSFAAKTSWTPSHSSPESSEAMIAQSGCLCSSPRSRCCLCSSPRRRCRRSRCRLCSSPRRRCSRCSRGQRGLPRLCRGSAHGETDLTTGELDRRSWQRVCMCSTVLSL